MNYQENQKVKVKSKENILVEGTLLNKADFASESLWWVKYGDKQVEVSLFSIEHLDEWNKVEPACECGKDKHGFASHSRWCSKYL